MLRTLGSFNSAARCCGRSAIDPPPAAPPASGLHRARLADRRRVLDAALVPKPIEAAVDLQRRAFADIALEHLPVVTDSLHYPDGPVLGQSELLAEIAFCADKALDLWARGFHHFVHVLRRDSELLGVDHREEDPLYDIKPLVVAVPHGGPEWLLGYDLWQDHVVVRVGEPQPFSIEAGRIRRVGHPAAPVT